MSPPTSIDGTDITGATIDGTDVTEITVDGDTVFSARTLPVAYSNLIAWYPFDSAEYGGSNADDVTAIIGGSGDDTAYNGTVNGATYQSTAGATDINAGANSGAFEFDGSNDVIDDTGIPFDSTNPFSVTFWGSSQDSGGGSGNFVNTNDFTNGFRVIYFDGPGEIFFETENSGSRDTAKSAYTRGDFIHIAAVFDGSTNELFFNGSSVDTTSSIGSGSDPLAFEIGGNFNSPSAAPLTGKMDDVRIYDTALSASQIDQIYQNTEP